MPDIVLNLSVDDTKRLLSGVRERKRKADRGLKKFADNFDPVLGQNLRNAFDNALRLERYMEGVLNDYYSREPAVHRDERQGRGEAPRLHDQDGD